MSKLKLKITQPKKKEDTPKETNSRENTDQKERRETPRVDLETKVRYQILGHPSKEVISQNISAGGMCLLLDRKISPRMILELEFKLPGDNEDMINTYAEVIWQSNSHTGIKFISI
jgi:c-di-GMP-binding flagellar brake protein YcgR